MRPAAAGFERVTEELAIRVEPEAERQARETAVARTLAAIREQWQGNNGRINQARAFIKRAKKSDRRRRQEKASRKRNRH